MKNDTKKVAAFDVDSDGDDDDAFALGDFDPEELLKSPLLNNSTNGFSNSLSENSFGTYEVEDVLPSKLCSVSPNGLQGNSSRGSEFAQSRNFDVSKHRPMQQPLYSLPSRSAVGMNASEPSDNCMGEDLTPGYTVPYSNQPVSPPRRMESIKQVPLPSAPMTPPRQDNFSAQGQVVDFQMQIPQQQGGYHMHMEQDHNIQHQVNSNYEDVQMNSMTNSMYYSQTPNNNNFGIQTNSQVSASYGGQPMQGSLSQSSSSYGSPSRQSSAYSGGCQQDVNPLQQMQHYISQMQTPPHLSNNNNIGLSQTIHGEPYRRQPSSPMMSATQSLNQSMHEHNNNSLRSNSFHGTSRFASGGITFSNVSIASDVQNSKNFSSELDLNSQSNHSQTPAPLNEAMEKLCESMKRSAMSRSLIKQYSGRGSMMKQGSSRGLMRQNSGRMMGKGGTLMDDGSSGRGTPTGSVPIRRVSLNAKHHLQHPSRGIYRHDSQQSLNGCSNHSISLHFDGRNMGAL